MTELDLINIELSADELERITKTKAHMKNIKLSRDEQELRKAINRALPNMSSHGLRELRKTVYHVLGERGEYSNGQVTNG